MAEVVREVIADNIMEGKEPRDSVSSRTFTKELIEEKNTVQASASSSYLLAEDQSAMSREIDHWMNGSQIMNGSPAENIVQTSVGRVPVVQRSVLARSSSLETYGLWYILAMVLPLFSVSNCPHWRCTPSLVLNTAELMMTRVSHVFSRMRGHLRNISQDQVTRQVFATAMDVILVVYAIGFLVLSMYQASIFA